MEYVASFTSRPHLLEEQSGAAQGIKCTQSLINVNNKHTIALYYGKMHPVASHILMGICTVNLFSF